MNELLPELVRALPFLFLAAMVVYMLFSATRRHRIGVRVGEESTKAVREDTEAVRELVAHLKSRPK